MRLLVDCHIFDGKFQGARTYLQGLYQQMVKYSDIDFYFAAQNIERLKTCFGDNRNIHYIQLKSCSGIKRLSLEFHKLIKENFIDYAHYQYISPLRKLSKEIVTIHDLLFLDYPSFFSRKYKYKNSFFFRRSARRADILLTVSEYSRNAIIKHFNIPPSQIHVTPNAVLFSKLTNDNIDVKAKYGLDKYIITVSRIEPRKNHLALLKSFIELKLYERGYKLVFVGEPDLTYKSFALFYLELPQNIKDFILFLSVPYKELVELYRNASLFVFPSFAEGFGIPPLEAIENNCLVLCSNATAMAEYHFPQEMSFAPTNIDEMKRKMLFLLDNHFPLDDIKQELKKKYSWEKSASILYKLLLSDNHQPDLSVFKDSKKGG